MFLRTHGKLQCNKKEVLVLVMAKKSMARRILGKKTMATALASPMVPILLMENVINQKDPSVKDGQKYVLAEDAHEEA